MEHAAAHALRALVSKGFTAASGSEAQRAHQRTWRATWSTPSSSGASATSSPTSPGALPVIRHRRTARHSLEDG